MKKIKDESRFVGFSIQEREYKGEKQLCAVFKRAHHRRKLVNGRQKTEEIASQAELEKWNLPAGKSWEGEALKNLQHANKAKDTRPHKP